MRKSTQGLLWSVMMMITAMLLIINEYTGNSQFMNVAFYIYIGMFILGVLLLLFNLKNKTES
jgi:hypothetical protein